MLYVVYIWELNITRTPEKVINTMINNYTKLNLSHTSTPRTEVLQLVFFEFMFEFMLWINISQVRSSCPQSLFGHTGFQNCSPDLTFGKSIFFFFLGIYLFYRYRMTQLTLQQKVTERKECKFTDFFGMIQNALIIFVVNFNCLLTYCYYSFHWFNVITLRHAVNTQRETAIQEDVHLDGHAGEK